MFDPTKPHHTLEGFRNNHPSGPRGSFWKWQRERWEKGLPKVPEGGYRFEQLKPDVAWLKSNRGAPTLTWIGHATFLLQLRGVNILTDPHLTQRASPFAFTGPVRVVPPALDFRDLPHIDAVVISHNHYDHLDLGTVKHLAGQAAGSPLFFVPLGLKAWFVGHGMHNVVELDWWESEAHAGLVFHLVPVQHWSARTPWDRDRTLWGGWVVEDPGDAAPSARLVEVRGDPPALRASRAFPRSASGLPPGDKRRAAASASASGFRFFFAGDTGYSRDFLDIAARFGQIDLAAIPIGAYEPRWFMSIMHVNPEEAVRIHQDLGARYSVGMHWGTFILTDEPLDEPPHRLASARRAAGVSAEHFFLMKHGETRRLSAMMRPVVAPAEAIEPVV